MRLAAAAALLAVLATGAAPGGPGEAAATFLRVPVGARAIGMGGAYTAVADDPYAMHYNPAGLGWIQANEVAFQYNQSILDFNQQYIGYVHPLLHGSIGLSWNRFDFGTFDQTLITSGTTFTRTGLFDASSNAVTFSYGRPIGERLSLGAQGKWIWEDIAGFTAATGAVDLGIHYRDPGDRLRIGATLQNLGPEIKFLSRSDPLPRLVRLGIAYQPTDRILVTSDFEKAVDSDYIVRFGAEYWVARAMAVRAGFDPTSDEGRNYTVGMGFRWRDFKLDYAFTDEGALDATHKVSLGFRWGGGQGDDGDAASRGFDPKIALRRPRKPSALASAPAPQDVSRAPLPASYYILIGEARYGPASLEILKRWNEEGRIPAAAWIWKEGDPEWDWRAKSFFFPAE